MKLFAFALVFFALGCGGGGGGGSNDVAGVYRGVLALIENTCANPIGNSEIALTVNQAGERVVAQTGQLSFEGFDNGDGFTVFTEIPVSCTNFISGADGVASAEIQVTSTNTTSDGAQITWTEDYSGCVAPDSIPVGDCSRLWSGIFTRN